MAKKLLEESTVRRFMKIAGLQPLSENFVQNLPEGEEEASEEGPEMEQPEAEAEMAPEPEMEKLEGEEEVEVEMGEEGMMGEDEKVKLLQQLAQALGIDVEVEGEEEAGEDMEAGEEMGGEEESEESEEMAEEMPLEEGEHMEETPVDPAGHSLEKMEPMTGSKHAPKDAAMSAMPKGKQEHMAESREAFKKRLVEQVAKRVAARLKDLK